MRQILIEMRWYRRPPAADRRRRLLALSRFDETPGELVIELNTDGTDYLSRGSFADEEFSTHWRLLEGLLGPAERKLSRDEILAGWPAEDRPYAITFVLLGSAARWKRGCCGKRPGQIQNPFRYWLPASEERWRRDPVALILMPELIQPPAENRPVNRRNR